MKRKISLIFSLVLMTTAFSSCGKKEKIEEVSIESLSSQSEDQVIDIDVNEGVDLYTSAFSKISKLSNYTLIHDTLISYTGENSADIKQKDKLFYVEGNIYYESGGTATDPEGNTVQLDAKQSWLENNVYYQKYTYEEYNDQFYKEEMTLDTLLPLLIDPMQEDIKFLQDTITKASSRTKDGQVYLLFTFDIEKYNEYVNSEQSDIAISSAEMNLQLDSSGNLVKVTSNSIGTVNNTNVNIEESVLLRDIDSTTITALTEKEKEVYIDVDAVN